MNCDEYKPSTLVHEYYEVYIMKTIKFLREHYSDSEISSILTISLSETYSGFNNYLCNTIEHSNKTIVQVDSIKAIYSILQRILTGTLTREDTLMINLRKIAPKNSIEELNALVKKQITIPFLLHKLETPSETTAYKHC